MNGSGVYAHIWLSKSGSSLARRFPTISTRIHLTPIPRVLLMPSSLEAILATSQRTSSNTISFSILHFAVIGLVMLMPRADALELAHKPSLILQTSRVSLTVDSSFFADVDADADSDCGDSCQVQDQVPQGLPEAIEELQMYTYTHRLPSNHFLTRWAELRPCHSL